MKLGALVIVFQMKSEIRTCKYGGYTSISTHTIAYGCWAYGCWVYGCIAVGVGISKGRVLGMSVVG